MWIADVAEYCTRLFAAHLIRQYLVGDEVGIDDADVFQRFDEEIVLHDARYRPDTHA